MRVHKLALRLGKEEGVDADILEIIEYSSILHDVADWKYSGDDNAGPRMAAAFLQVLDLHSSFPVWCSNPQ